MPRGLRLRDAPPPACHCGGLMQHSALASFVTVVAIWCICPLLKRYVTLELETHHPHPSWSYTVLHSTLCTGLAWVAQLASPHRVVAGWVMLPARALVVSVANAALSTLCGFVLTWLIAHYNPGHVMAGLNSVTVFVSFCIGSALYSTCTANGLCGAFLMSLGAYLILEDKNRPK